jgi:hypothetical protein
MKKFGFAAGKGLGKQEQGTKDPITFIKNYHTKGMGTKNVVHGMKQLGVTMTTKLDTTLLSSSRAPKLQHMHHNQSQTS